MKFLQPILLRIATVSVLTLLLPATHVALCNNNSEEVDLITFHLIDKMRKDRVRKNIWAKEWKKE
jgi:hypothetical protein